MRRPQIWIPEIEYYQKMFSHAQIGPQGAEKQQSKVNVVVSADDFSDRSTTLSINHLSVSNTFSKWWNLLQSSIDVI